jgi:N6-adenosine-specific RNA methylase IME4
MILFGVKGSLRTLKPGRSQVNIVLERKREHSRKPDGLYPIVESCSPGPYLELFARGPRKGWSIWGNEAEDYEITWDTYANNSQNEEKQLELDFEDPSE